MTVLRRAATRLFLVRHGETAWNAQDRIQGTVDVPLNDAGRAQAACLARYFAQQSLDAIYSSDLVRAAVTARAIAQTVGRTVREWALLRERQFGLWEGLTGAELAREFGRGRAADASRVPLAETRAEQAERARLLLTFASLGWEGASIAAVSHEGFIKQCILAALGMEPEQRRGVVVSRGSVSLLEQQSGAWRPVFLNHVPG